MTLFSTDHSLPPDAFRARLHGSPMGSPLPGQALPGQPLPGQHFGSPYVGQSGLSSLSAACSRSLAGGVSGAAGSIRGVLGAVTSSPPAAAASNGLLGGQQHPLPPHHLHLQQSLPPASGMLGSPVANMLNSVARSPLAPLGSSGPGVADGVAMRHSNLGAISLNSVARSLPTGLAVSGTTFGLTAAARAAAFGPSASVSSSSLGVELVPPPPPSLSLSDFPSLSTRAAGALGELTGGHGVRHPPAGVAPGQNNSVSHRTPYVGMVKQQNSETTEFTMSSEDFPALPGSSDQRSGSGNPVGSGSSASTNNGSQSVSQGVENCDTQITANDSSGNTTTCSVSGNSQLASSSSVGNSGAVKQAAGGIQLYPGGRVANIPRSMLADQFGMVGFLAFIRTAEADANLAQLAQGYDLTTLGLNLKSSESQYLTYGGAWAETQCRAQDIDFYVPREYLTNVVTREKLAPISLSRYGEDLLFYLFYMNAGDVLQILAARELYNREWRYHMEERVWITRAPGVPLLEKAASFERGTYYYFDPTSWRKVSREFCLVYEKLDTRIDPPKYSAVL